MRLLVMLLLTLACLATPGQKTGFLLGGASDQDLKSLYDDLSRARGELGYSPDALPILRWTWARDEAQLRKLGIKLEELPGLWRVDCVVDEEGVASQVALTERVETAADRAAQAVWERFVSGAPPAPLPRSPWTNAVSIRSADSGRVATLRWDEDKRQNGLRLWAYNDGGHKAQRWYLVPSGDGYQIVSVFSGYPVGPSLQGNVCQFHQNGAVWKLERQPDGSYRISSRAGKVWDLSGSLDYDEVKPILVYDWNGDSNQRWWIQEDPRYPPGVMASDGEYQRDLRRIEDDRRKRRAQLLKDKAPMYWGDWESPQAFLSIKPNGTFEMFLFAGENAVGRWSMLDSGELELVGRVKARAWVQSRSSNLVLTHVEGDARFVGSYKRK